LTNDDIYAFEPELARLYRDRHIQPKIRQPPSFCRCGTTARRGNCRSCATGAFCNPSGPASGSGCEVQAAVVRGRTASTSSFRRASSEDSGTVITATVFPVALKTSSE